MHTPIMTKYGDWFKYSNMSMSWNVKEQYIIKETMGLGCEFNSQHQIKETDTEENRHLNIMHD